MNLPLVIRSKSMAVIAVSMGLLVKGGEQKLDPGFAEVLFKLQEGETSDIVLTDYGYHIIRVVKRIEGNIPEQE